MHGRLAGIAFAALFAALLGTAVAVAHFVSTPSATEGQAVTFADSLALASNRPTLRICLDGVGTESVDSTAVQRVEEAVRALREDVAIAGYADSVLAQLDSLRVVRGCPRPVALDASARRFDEKTGLDTVMGRPTAKPSKNILQVYVVPSATFRAWFGDETFVAGVEELLCDGLSCGPVTIGIYVTKLGTPTEIHQLLRDIRFVLPSRSAT